MMARMPQRDYEVVVVGARCAGAAVATLLARAGAKVLLLDKATLPSDHVLSTHSINPPGMDVLDELGVGDAVRAVAPPSRLIRVNVEGTVADIPTAEGRALYCPRRQRLDALLQEAAVASGARLLDRTRVVALVHDDGRVVGVRVAGADGERVVSAELVVGADGRHSTVAQLVEAEEYLGYDAPRAVYWAYWNAPSLWNTDPAYRFDMYFGQVGGLLRVIFQTDHHQLLIGAAPPANRVGAWRADPYRTLQAALARDPVIEPLVRDSRPDGHVRGTVRERYYFRRAAGRGWTLVGDAGHHKEFQLGDGITEALLQARSLAAAIRAGSDAALARWWRARDVEALPLYFWGKEAGVVEPPLELLQLVFSHIGREPDLKARFAAVIDRRLSPFEMVPATRAARWVLGAAVRGRWGVLGQLVGAGRRGLAVTRELRAREALLTKAEAAGREETGRPPRPTA
jgi:flavin-dependent dehydrogenase